MSSDQSNRIKRNESSRSSRNDVTRGDMSTNQSIKSTQSLPKPNENIYHYAGKVHVRGLLRRVWRPRYLALGDDGYLRYHESIPPPLQQSTPHNNNQSASYLAVRHTHRPKSVLAVLDGARVIHPYSEADQFVALPRGVHGFVFRGRPVDPSIRTASGGRGEMASARDAVIVPPSHHASAGDEGKHKPAKAVVNAMFPKGTSRRKTAQKIAKAVSEKRRFVKCANEYLCKIERYMF